MGIKARLRDFARPAKERPLDEGVWPRAWADTHSAERIKGGVWQILLALAVLLVSKAAGVGEWIDQAWQNGLYLVALIALAVFIRFAWNLFRAPYRQRNEARALVRGTSAFRDAVRSLRARPAKWLLDPRKNLVDLTLHLGPALLEWASPEALGDFFCPRNPDGTITGQRWLADGYGSAKNAAKDFCKEMVARGFMEDETATDIRVLHGQPIPVSTPRYRWNDQGRQLYEYAVNEERVPASATT